jgi:hypothetical protein
MTEQAAGLLGSSLLVPESDKFFHNQRLGLVTAKPGVALSSEFSSISSMLSMFVERFMTVHPG